MKFITNRLFQVFAISCICGLLTACPPKESSQGTATAVSTCTVNNSATTYTSMTAAANVLTIGVNDTSYCTLTNGGQPIMYVDEPCVRVTVCKPPATSGVGCLTFNHILLDTGSYGLRIFKNAVATDGSSQLSGLGLSNVTAHLGGTEAECVQFGDGTSEWGPVATANVIMSGETASNLPVHVIDSTFSGSGVPSICTSPKSKPDTSPTSSGFNGILGVGLFIQDCGATCVTSASPGLYYSCTGTTCAADTATLANQVTNPVAGITSSSDNNGVTMHLPAVPDGGAGAVDGYLVMGIGTQSNNSPSGLTAFKTDTRGDFKTTFGQFSNIMSFIDSGSDAYYFPQPNSTFADCGGNLTGSYCPASLTANSAQNTAATGSPSNCVGFNVGNASALYNSPNWVFNNFAGGVPVALGTSFDWGLPFFLGRNVVVQFETKTTVLYGLGPLWAY